MNATSFQVPASFVWSSPKHDEPWSRSPVVNAAQIMILLLAGMVPLPRLAAISVVCCSLGFGSYRALSDTSVNWFTLALTAEQRIRKKPLKTRVIVASNDLNTSGHRR